MSGRIRIAPAAPMPRPIPAKTLEPCLILDFTGNYRRAEERELPQDRIARIAERLPPAMALLDPRTGLRREEEA